MEIVLFNLFISHQFQGGVKITCFYSSVSHCYHKQIIKIIKIRCICSSYLLQKPIFFYIRFQRFYKHKIFIQCTGYYAKNSKIYLGSFGTFYKDWSKFKNSGKLQILSGYISCFYLAKAFCCQRQPIVRSGPRFLHNVDLSST